MDRLSAHSTLSSLRRKGFRACAVLQYSEFDDATFVSGRLWSLRDLPCSASSVSEAAKRMEKA